LVVSESSVGKTVQKMKKVARQQTEPADQEKLQILLTEVQNLKNQIFYLQKSFIQLRSQVYRLSPGMKIPADSLMRCTFSSPWSSSLYKILSAVLGLHHCTNFLQQSLVFIIVPNSFRSCFVFIMYKNSLDLPVHVPGTDGRWCPSHGDRAGLSAGGFTGDRQNTD